MQRFIERFRALASTRLSGEPTATLEGLPGLGEAELDGRRALNFATGDALGLATDARVKEAAQAATRRFGTQGGRGQQGLRELEQRLALFLGRDQVLVCADPGSTLSALGLQADQLCLDARTATWPLRGLWEHHPAVVRFDDVDAVESALLADPERCTLIVASGVHPDEGDLSALPRLSELALRFGAALVIDESNSLGVLGDNGAGAAAQMLGREVGPLLLASLDGALASRGVLLAGPSEIITGLRDELPDGALPSPALVAAALKALEIIQAEPGRRTRLFEVTQRLMIGLRQMGLDTGPSVTPRVPVWVGDEVRCRRLQRALLESGLWCREVLTPNRARLLLLPQATHTDAQIDQALQLIERVGRKMGLVADDRPPSVAAVELSRPGAFLQSAPCAPHWRQLQAGGDEVAASGRPISERLFSAVETLTWRAANLRGSDLRKLLQRPGDLLRRRR